MKEIACFDIGGTFIKYAVMDSEGSILFKGKVASPTQNCKETIPEIIIARVREFQEAYNIHAIGICTPGQVDSEKGEIIFSSENLPGYTGAKISEVISEKLGIKTCVENDVNAAALGELWRGAARGKSTFVCITLGTGVGGAIVIDNKLYKGMSGGAGEFGHMIINEHGEKCNCGSRGCYERYASTSAFLRMYDKQAKEKGYYIEEINGEKIMSRVHEGEKLACEVYDSFIDNIVIGLVNIVHMLDPGLVVIGGGISAQGEEFIGEIKRRFKEKAMPVYGENTEILPAKLQNDAGIYGACYIALNR